MKFGSGDQAKAERQADENGHRMVLVDNEILTVVEGDLILDDDQKDLWQEAQTARILSSPSSCAPRLSDWGKRRSLSVAK